MDELDSSQPDAPSAVPRERMGPLEQGREAYAQRAWDDAYRRLSQAHRACGLAADDLERLALSAYLVQRDDEYLDALGRAHRAHLQGGNPERAVRCAFWLGLRLAFRGEVGAAAGWFARAQRLLQALSRPCLEQGYLLLPDAEQRLESGDPAAAGELAERAGAIGEQFTDPDLVACARHIQGRALLEQGRIPAGVVLLDEAMVAVTAGELSPLMTGLIYCSVIEACQRVYLYGRAGEWTLALADWCREQPQMLAFSGPCRVHRAEVLQLQGDWPAAVEQAQRACREHADSADRRAAAAACYRLAEIHRLRGAFDAAEEAYGQAAREGRDPLPGLALLRLAQGRTPSAVQAVCRALETVRDRLQRAALLAAAVEIQVQARAQEQAHCAGRELEEIARSFDTDALSAMAAHARGSVELLAADARAALQRLRRAFEIWHRLGARYETAQVRVRLGLAYRMLGDEEGAGLELAAAGTVFSELGAVPDARRVEVLRRPAAHPGAPRLTSRELQVLRLLAQGLPNKRIAAELALSEKTVERHLGNIYLKLEVSSRTAATAFAYRHGLI